MKVTVIGAGNMGGALIKGWAKNTEIELTITAKTYDTLNRFAQEWELSKAFDNIHKHPTVEKQVYKLDLSNL